MQPKAVSTGNTADIFIWGGISIVLMVGLWIVWVALRKWYFGAAQFGSSDGLWTLEDLRRMRDSGELSEDEYETLRRQAIAVYQDTNDETASE